MLIRARADVRLIPTKLNRSPTPVETASLRRAQPFQGECLPFHSVYEIKKRGAEKNRGEQYRQPCRWSNLGTSLSTIKLVFT